MTRPPPRARPAREAGFALLIVLWMLVLITLLVGTMTHAGQSEARIAASQRNAAIIRAAVDGAAQEGIFRVAAGQWQPGPAPHRLVIGAVPVLVVVEDEAGLVDPEHRADRHVERAAAAGGRAAAGRRPHRRCDLRLPGDLGRPVAGGRQVGRLPRRRAALRDAVTQLPIRPRTGRGAGHGLRRSWRG